MPRRPVRKVVGVVTADEGKTRIEIRFYVLHGGDTVYGSARNVTYERAVFHIRACRRTVISRQLYAFFER